METIYEQGRLSIGSIKTFSSNNKIYSEGFKNLQLPHRKSVTTQNKGYSSNKEIVGDLFNELNAIESKVIKASRPSLKICENIGDRKIQYERIVEKAKTYKSGKAKSNYLLKELESFNDRIESLEIDIKSLKKENDSWKNLLKKSNNNKDGNEELKAEVDYLKSIISEQNLKLELFKKEIIEKYDSVQNQISTNLAWEYYKYN